MMGGVLPTLAEAPEKQTDAFEGLSVQPTPTKWMSEASDKQAGALEVSSVQPTQRKSEFSEKQAEALEGHSEQPAKWMSEKSHQSSSSEQSLEQVAEGEVEQQTPKDPLPTEASEEKLLVKPVEDNGQERVQNDL